MLNITRILIIVLIILISGCAVTPVQTPPPVNNLPAKIQPVRTKPVVPAEPATGLSDQQVYELVLKLLPDYLKDKEGWAADLQNPFHTLHITPNAQHFCSVIAIIEQESSFQVNPVIPGLPAIVRREIEQRRDKYRIPQTVIDWILSSTSYDGRSYQQRFNTLKTEKELSDLIEEIVAIVPAGKELFPNYNPIRTGGPMQVSVEFAESHARVRPYPYTINGSLRNEVFSRRGGIYFGSAILLDYPAPYDDMLYRFADFNAGRYSSRNAAFQMALSRLSGKPLAADGDLLRYKDGNIAPEPSSTLNTLRGLSNTLQMSETDIQRDLRLEKHSTFSKTPLYVHLFALADRTGSQPRVVLPEIDLKSPKIRRKLTTQWFANRVNGRYKGCLQQAGFTTAKPAEKLNRSTR